MIIKGKTGNWEIVIGLEIHAQVTSNTKLFSSSATAFGAEPNTQVSFIDAAMPGMLPVLNEKCVEQAVRTGLGLGAKVNLMSMFDRKNYFYADLPQGYQISQFNYPIVSDGKVVIETVGDNRVEVSIQRIHLEQDAGKSIHDQSPNESFIDLNRCGVALMEIVTNPDMRSPEEAAEFVKKLRSVLRYLGTCDGDMEKGSMRCDANVSVRKEGNQALGTRVEIKNINSMRNIVRAITFEAERQVNSLESGGLIAQETRLFDANNGITRSMRSKEEASDYRYFPDPDLLPLYLSEDYIANIKATLPELPDQKISRYIKDYGLSSYDASVLVADKVVAEYFEAVAELATPKDVANWIISELFGRLNKKGLEIDQSLVSPQGLAELVNLIENNVISGKMAKTVFDTMFETGQSPSEIVEQEGLRQVSDVGELEAIIDDILNHNTDKVLEFKAGKDKLFAFFIGQVMQKTRGKANPSLVNEILQQKLSSRR